MQTNKITFSSNISFGHNLSKATHKNLLALLKKMHAQDTLTKSATEVKSSAVCELTTDTMNLNTCKFPSIKSSTMSADEYVSNGRTSLKLASKAIIDINNKDGKIIRIIDDLKQSWENLEKQASYSIKDALNNYKNDSVKKHVYTIRMMA